MQSDKPLASLVYDFSKGDARSRYLGDCLRRHEETLAKHKKPRSVAGFRITYLP
jgi:hypothetical protein